MVRLLDHMVFVIVKDIHIIRNSKVRAFESQFEVVKFRLHKRVLMVLFL